MPEMTVVNTSPLFYLHRLGYLEVLNRLYDNVTIPESVRRKHKDTEGIDKKP